MPQPSSSQPRSSLHDQPPPDSSVRVHKFGGSSLADAARIGALTGLLEPDAQHPRLVVVSAMQGSTDALVDMAQLATTGGDWRHAWQSLADRYRSTATQLQLDGSVLDALEADLQALNGDLQDLTNRAATNASDLPSDRARLARIHGTGERLASRLVQASLGTDWQRLDAREVLVVYPGEMGVGVDWDATRARFAAWRAAHPDHSNIVATGFIARDRSDLDATLGRNGSDYSAAIFAKLCNAAELTIWTDVDGVLSADPRRVPDAVCLPTMSYAEACELAYFGAKVLHPQTMAPVQECAIPLRIRNTLNPAAPGTLINVGQDGSAPEPVKGISLVENLAVLELAGNGMIGVSGTAERMFAALHAVGVSVTMISQGSSEHSICCIVREDQVERGLRAVESAFADEIRQAQAQTVRSECGISVLAAVGDGMVGTPGVAARLLGGLAQAQVNVRAVAQGASERNISVAVAQRDATRALRAAHAAFWLSPQTLSIGLIGTGKVGRTLLQQLIQAQPRLHRAGVDLRLRAIATSRHMVFSETGFDDPAQVTSDMDTQAMACDLDAFTAHVHAEHLPHALIIDCTASDAVAERYPDWLHAGIHVVTPNKHAGSGDWQRYAAILAAQAHGGRFLYEATVGAGLPVIRTLRDLLDTGDALRAVDGILSGTLAWLFNRFDGSRPFSDLVREARAQGYTEPDPRDDLSGLDVARKLVILARESGRRLSLEDVQVTSLVPPQLRDIALDEFLDRLPELDAPIQAQLEQARSAGHFLRHLAQLDDNGHAQVGVVALPPDHSCCHTRLTDSLVQFRTARYADNPLVVQGPGAGPTVTAAGVFADVLAVAQSLGARLAVIPEPAT